MSADVHVDLDLVRRYNQPGPRYTSYPTAPHFTEDYGPGAFTDDLNAGSSESPLSLYLHLPFCRSLCYYCGCHMKVTQKPETIATYLDALKKEIDLMAAQMDTDRPVVQMHWGGGTPTYLTADQIRALGAHLRTRFRFADDAEISLEADPRGLTEDRIAAAADVGFNRISIGVQDVNREVQEAINRVQPVELIEQAVHWARAHAFNGVNFDLVYGLPHQTRERFEKTIDVTRELGPDRIALYSYAHVPSIKKHQRVIDEDTLPDPEDKLRLFKLGLERLTQGGGYRFIGMDHFARPDDALARAQDRGDLHRNFQGYSTRAGAEVVAFGVSGISQLDGAYAQNVKGFPAYYDRIENERPATYRGYRLTPDDRLRRHVIMQLMCHFHLDKAAVEERFGVDFDETFGAALEALRPMEADGLVTLTPGAVHVRPPGRLLVRNVAMAFDAYWTTDEDRPVHAQTV
jgi:oxygen-independent coproporphyrinogen-3 oxidase